MEQEWPETRLAGMGPMKCAQICNHMQKYAIISRLNANLHFLCKYARKYAEICIEICTYMQNKMQIYVKIWTQYGQICI